MTRQELCDLAVKTLEKFRNTDNVPREENEISDRLLFTTFTPNIITELQKTVHSTDYSAALLVVSTDILDDMVTNSAFSAWFKAETDKAERLKGFWGTIFNIQFWGPTIAKPPIDIPNRFVMLLNENGQFQIAYRSVQQ